MAEEAVSGTGSPVRIKWAAEVADHYYAAAEAYLSLKFDEEAVAKAVQRLRKGALTARRANDILRAAGLTPAPLEDPGVIKDLISTNAYARWGDEQEGSLASPVCRWHGRSAFLLPFRREKTRKQQPAGSVTDPQCRPRGQGVATIGAVFLKRKDQKRMLDQLRSDITSRLEDLLGEADKLRRALIALDPRHRAETPATASTPSTQSRRGSGSRPSSGSTTTGRERTPARASRSTKSKTSTRTAPGATKGAILAALGNGDAMTAGEVATATGIGQATVSTTLSRLAKAGEVTKATRGYQANKSAS